MKRNLLSLFTLFIVIIFYSFADTELNCYQKFESKFNERGSNEVEDGWHSNVVITLRKGNFSECLIGKVQVEKGIVTQIHIRFADGTYDRFTKKFKVDSEKSITNGISKTAITTDGELVNILFVNHIKPPKKLYAPAPDPDDL